MSRGTRESSFNTESGGRGFRDIWSKYLGNSGFTKEILVVGREKREGGSYKTLARGSWGNFSMFLFRKQTDSKQYR